MLSGRGEVARKRHLFSAKTLNEPVSTTHQRRFFFFFALPPPGRRSGNHGIERRWVVRALQRSAKVVKAKKKALLVTQRRGSPRRIVLSYRVVDWMHTFPGSVFTVSDAEGERPRTIVPPDWIVDPFSSRSLLGKIVVIDNPDQLMFGVPRSASSCSFSNSLDAQYTLFQTRYCTTPGRTVSFDCQEHSIQHALFVAFHIVEVEVVTTYTDVRREPWTLSFTRGLFGGPRARLPSFYV